MRLALDLRRAVLRTEVLLFVRNRTLRLPRQLILVYPIGLAAGGIGISIRGPGVNRGGRGSAARSAINIQSVDLDIYAPVVLPSRPASCSPRSGNRCPRPTPVRHATERCDPPLIAHHCVRPLAA